MGARLYIAETRDRPFRVAMLDVDRRGDHRTQGCYATLGDALAAAEAGGYKCTVFEGWHVRAYVSPGETTVHPNQGFRFVGCPCQECAS